MSAIILALLAFTIILMGRPPSVDATRSEAQSFVEYQDVDCSNPQDTEERAGCDAAE